MGTRRSRDLISLVGATLDADLVQSTTVETAFAQKLTIKAGTLKVGDRFDFICAVKATSTNSTDTLVVKVKIADIVLGANTAIDVANNDVIIVQGWFVVTAIGAGSTASITFGSVAYKNAATAVSLTTVGARTTSSNFATTTDEDITVTGTWSVDHDNNIARLELLHFTQTDGKLAA